MSSRNRHDSACQRMLGVDLKIRVRGRAVGVDEVTAAFDDLSVKISRRKLKDFFLVHDSDPDNRGQLVFEDFQNLVRTELISFYQKATEGDSDSDEDLELFPENDSIPKSPKNIVEWLNDAEQQQNRAGPQTFESMKCALFCSQLRIYLKYEFNEY